MSSKHSQPQDSYDPPSSPLHKRPRTSGPLPDSPATRTALRESHDHELGAKDHHERRTRGHADESGTNNASSAKLASQAVAPFLTRHVPNQYAPLGNGNGQSTNAPNDPNSKFCYRHRPDMLCRRQADEPSMDKLQQDLDTLSQGDRQGIAHVWSLFSAAPSKHRNLILQGILAQCCFPQLSFLSANVRELIRIDFLAALPAEVSFRILTFLDTTSLCKAAQVSRRWRQLADDDVVWHRMCEQHIDRKCTKCGWGLPLLERKRLRASKRQIQLRATGRGINEWSPEITPNPEAFEEVQALADPLTDQASSDHEDVSTGCLLPVAHKNGSTGLVIPDNDYFKKTRPWKDVYKDRFKVGSNWKYGRCSTKIFAGHTNGVMCLQFFDNILATGSYDATIKIWNIETGKEIRTLRGHTMGIRCLQFDDTKLISGSLDKTLKIWNWRTGECLSTYNSHADGVISLHFDSNMLVSGSIDRTAKIWNFEDRSTCTLRGHTDWVNSVRIDSPSRTIFTASDDLTVRLWDLDTKKCIRKFEGHTGQVQQVLPLPREFELDDDELLRSVEDAGSPNSSPEQYFTHQSPQESLLPIDCRYSEAFANTDRPSPPKYILTSALDSTIRLWEVATGRCIRTLFGHVEGVWALGADTLRIVSGAEDRMVKVWDPRTGKCERTFTGHAGPVTCIGLSDSRMCSGSEDGEVRMYSFK